MRTSIPVLLMALLATAAAPPPAPPRHVDLARWAWASPAAEQRDRAVLSATRDSLVRAAGTPLDSGAKLRDLLRLADRARTLTRWHSDYLHVLSSIDTRDEASARGEDSLSNAEDQAFALVQDVLQRADAPAVESWLADDPRLERYRAFIAESCRRSHRPLSANEQELATQATSWPFRLYQRLEQDSTLNRDLCAFALQHTVRAQNAVAIARGFTDAPAYFYDRRQLTSDDVRRLVAAVRAHGMLFKRFEAARSRAYLLLRAAPPQALSLEATHSAMREALAPLGPELVRPLEQMFDPANGRLELGPGDHRRRGGFSFALPRGLHGVYLAGFSGSIRDASRLVHESGHALHYTEFESGGAPRVDSAYTADRRPGAAGRWMHVGLLYEDPLYLSNYLYSGFLITALYRQYVADPARFAPRYLAFMREPAAAPPAEMLRRTLGVSFDDPAALADAMRLLETQIAAYEAALDRYAAAHPAPAR